MSQALSNRICSISASPTLAIDARAKAMIAAGEDVINLTAGEPDYPTPDAAARAGIAAIEQHFTRYTPVAGIPALRESIADKLQRENGLTYSPDQIIVSAGAKQSLYNVFFALLNPGDEVVLQTPCWVSYPEQIKLCGGVVKPVAVDETSGFKMTPEQLAAAITPRTKAVLINSPANPTGTVYTPDEIAGLAEVLRKVDVYVVTDEIYERLTYDVRQTSIAAACPELQERTFVVNGFSKTYAMTGWRVGYVAGPRAVIDLMNNFQSHTTANASSVSQKAALGAFGTFSPTIVDEYRARRDLLLARLAELPDVHCTVPQGAFYAFPNFRAWVGRTARTADGAATRITSVDHLCELLLTEAKVSVVPGSAFFA
ncbi:MAG: pyridoxal phosphate-dependent aminotransferase, partial [Firmicutes bacterium]|nr:pyridoxal phosphate-dependent aminotransferase [Bacillota bacterium]